MLIWLYRILYAVLLFTHLSYLTLMRGFKQREDLRNTYGRGRSRRQFLSAYMVAAPGVSVIAVVILLILATLHSENGTGYVVAAALAMLFVVILSSITRAGNGAVCYLSLLAIVFFGLALFNSGAL